MWWRGVGFDAATSWIAVAGCTATRKESLTMEKTWGAFETATTPLRYLHLRAIGTAAVHNGPLRFEVEVRMPPRLSPNLTASHRSIVIMSGLPLLFTRILRLPRRSLCWRGDSGKQS